MIHAKILVRIVQISALNLVDFCLKKTVRSGSCDLDETLALLLLPGSYCCWTGWFSLLVTFVPVESLVTKVAGGRLINLPGSCSVVLVSAACLAAFCWWAVLLLVFIAQTVRANIALAYNVKSLAWATFLVIGTGG